MANRSRRLVRSAKLASLSDLLAILEKEESAQTMMNQHTIRSKPQTGELENLRHWEACQTEEGEEGRRPLVA